MVTIKDLDVKIGAYFFTKTTKQRSIKGAYRYVNALCST